MSKIIYRLATAPVGYKNYGVFAPQGPYTVYSKPRCPSCQISSEEDHIKMPTFEFLGGAISDFYAAGGPILVNEAIANVVSAAMRGAELTEVNIVGKLSAYEVLGKVLEIRCTPQLGYFCDSPGAKLVEGCSSCGRKRFLVSGQEKVETYADTDGELAFSISVKPGGGVIFSNSFFQTRNILRLSGFYFCTAELKNRLEEIQLKNLVFLRYGILDGHCIPQ